MLEQCLVQFSFASSEVRLETMNLRGERIMLRLVREEFGIPALSHEPFFGLKVFADGLNQRVQGVDENRPRESILPLRVECVQKLDQFFVLAIQLTCAGLVMPAPRNQSAAGRHGGGRARHDGGV